MSAAQSRGSNQGFSPPAYSRGLSYYANGEAANQGIERKCIRPWPVARGPDWLRVKLREAW